MNAEFDLEIGVHPVAALDHLFSSGTSLRRYDELTAEDFILAWCNTRERAATIDRALVAWIVEKWGRSTVEAVDGWKAICGIVEKDTRFLSARDALFDSSRIQSADATLLPITTSRSSDCMGAFLSALSSSKRQDLKAYWRSIAGVPPGYSWFHGRFGVIGLLHLVHVSEDKVGAIRDVGDALWRLAQAFRRMCTREGLQLRSEGQTEWSTAAMLTVPTTLVQKAWEQTSLSYLDWQSWYASKAQRVVKQESVSVQSARRGVNLGMEADEAAKKLTSGWPPFWLNKVLLALNELRAEAKEIGHSVWVVKTLCSASRAALLNGMTEMCEMWATEALDRAPWNPHAWEKLAHAKLLQKDYSKALELAWCSFGRFPIEPRAWLLLATVFKYCRRSVELSFLEAEASLRFGKRFADEIASGEFRSLTLAPGGVNPAINSILSKDARVSELRFLVRLSQSRSAQNLVTRIRELGGVEEQMNSDLRFVMQQQALLYQQKLSVEDATTEATLRLQSTPSSISVATHLTSLHRRQARMQQWSWQDKCSEVLSGLENLASRQRSYPLVPLAEAFGCLSTVDGQDRIEFAAERFERLRTDSFGLSEAAVWNDCSPVDDYGANDIQRRITIGAVQLSLNALLPTPKSEELEETSGLKLVGRFDRRVARAGSEVIWTACDRLLEDLAFELSNHGSSISVAR